MYNLLSTFLVIFPFESIETAPLVSILLISTKLENFFNKLAPFCIYNVELFLTFNSSILLKENNTLECSFVLSVAPASQIAQLSKVTVFALWIEILDFGCSAVP